MDDKYKHTDTHIHTNEHVIQVTTTKILMVNSWSE